MTKSDEGMKYPHCLSTLLYTQCNDNATGTVITVVITDTQTPHELRQTILTDKHLMSHDYKLY